MLFKCALLYDAQDPIVAPGPIVSPELVNRKLPFGDFGLLVESRLVQGLRVDRHRLPLLVLGRRRSGQSRRHREDPEHLLFDHTLCNSKGYLKAELLREVHHSIGY